MTERRLTDKLVIATHNRGKLAEFRELLVNRIAEIVSAGELALPEPEETGADFLANAAIKALAAARASGLPALADDSGLCVHALGNQPGLFSARWAQGGKDMQGAMQRIQNELGDATDRSAHFICALVLAWPDGQTRRIEGRCDGTIVWPARGQGGHGYDPIFQPDGQTRTFAEMTAAEKHALSHRGRALAALLALLDSL